MSQRILMNVEFGAFPTDLDRPVRCGYLLRITSAPVTADSPVRGADSGRVTRYSYNARPFAVHKS
jgi:hypothetical protein